MEGEVIKKITVKDLKVNELAIWLFGRGIFQKVEPASAKALSQDALGIIRRTERRLV